MDPNRLCSDPDPSSHVPLGPDPDLALEPNRMIRIRLSLDPDPAWIFFIVGKSKFFVQMLFLGLKFSLKLF